MKDKNKSGLEKKSILRKFLDDYVSITDAIIDYTGDFLQKIGFVGPNALKLSYGRKKIQEFKEKGIDLYEYRKKNSKDGIVSI